MTKYKLPELKYYLSWGEVWIGGAPLVSLTSILEEINNDSPLARLGAVAGETQFHIPEHARVRPVAPLLVKYKPTPSPIGKPEAWLIYQIYDLKLT